MLTVSDVPGFSRNGGIIGLVLVDRRVRFEINLAHARQVGLTLRASLLDLATVVLPPP